MFDCDVMFGQEEYSLILRNGVKDAPFSTSDQRELTNVRAKYDMALNELLEDENLIDRIELQIRRAIEHQVSSRGSVAKALGQSERSMARALADKGTSFKAIKQHILSEMAFAKINQGLRLSEVAQALGYNDQSAFTRAYKKWFGYPPGKGKESPDD